MSFKCTFKLEEPYKQPASMTITMPLEEWGHLAEHLRKNPHWVGNSVASSIYNLIDQARKHFTAEGEYPHGN